jgi:hypothetical protein
MPRQPGETEASYTLESKQQGESYSQVGQGFSEGNRESRENDEETIVGR